MNEESRTPGIDPELEARIVALVLGEASDFERDELNRLIEERSELAAFKEQIQGVHGLLRDVATGESVAEDDDWKLSSEKRGAVLAAIGGETEGQSAEHVVIRALPEEQRPVGRGRSWNLTKIAAAVCVAGVLAVLTIPAWFDGAMNEPLSRFRQLSLAEHNYHSARSTEGRGDPRLVLGDESAPRAKAVQSGGTVTVTTEDEYLRTAEPAATVDLDYAKHSRSTLSAIRGTLNADGVLPSPYYLNDDVQYVPAVPEFKVLGDATRPLESRAGENQNRVPTAGVGGPGPGLSPQTVDHPAMITEYDSDWSDRLDGDGYRPADSQPNVPNSGNGELSFPMFAGPGRSTVSVPDTGTVLLGGVKRLVEGRTEHGVSGEPTVSSPTAIRDYGESESGGETQGVASGRTAALGLGDRPVLDGKPESPPDFAVQALGSQEPDQETNFSRGERRLRGGTTFRFGVIDSLAGEKDKEINGIVADGETSAGIGGTAQANGLGKDISAEHESEEVAGGELDVWRKTGELAGAEPPRSTMAGMGGGAGRMESLDNSGLEASETKGLDTDKLAISLPSPTTKTKSWGEEVKSRELRTLAESRKEEVAKERFTVPSDDDIAIHNGRAPDHNALYSLQMPEAVTGTAIVQPFSKLEAGQSIQDNRWGYARADQPAPTTRRNDSHAIEKRVKDSLGKISALSELYENSESAEDVLADDYNENGTRSWHRPQVELKDEQEDLLRRRSRLAISGRNHWNGYVPPMLENNSESMRAWGTKSTAPSGLQEKTAEDEAFSTFSLHVSDVSFKLAQAALAHGEWPEAAQVRIEEFINAFDYGDPMPSQSERVSCRLEQSIHPFLQQRNLLRISMRTAAEGRSSNTPLRLTFLLDNSGSMERIDRRQTVRRAFALLAQQLTPIDQVTLISFARQPRLLVDKVSGAQSHQLVQLIADLPSEGGTNIEAALQLAFEKAKEQQVDDAQNRIILLTDGAVNLGDANPESLSRIITTMRGAGIAFDAAGISAEGLNDEVLEALTRKGDGRYYLLDSLEAADDGFARQIAGALRPSAKNVKVQIEFNPQRVGRYKLLGFEKHRLKQEDFRNDTVDASEMAAEEAGVAMYQFEAKPEGEGDVGSVSVRFRDLSTGQMIENRWPIPYQADAPRPDQAAPSMRIATSAAMLAAKLRGEPLGETVDLKTLSDLIAGLPDRDRNADRVQQLQRMIQQARQVSGQ